MLLFMPIYVIMLFEYSYLFMLILFMIIPCFTLYFSDFAFPTVRSAFSVKRTNSRIEFSWTYLTYYWTS